MTNPISQQKIQHELIEMALSDQQMRIGHQAGKARFDPNLDKRNLSALKKIVGMFGWPTVELVGDEAAHAAWLIIQHADADVDFQEECLQKMKAAGKDSVNPKHIAYLTDRVAVNRGRKQTYGTQFYRNKEGEIVPRPIRNIKDVDKRRREAGLEPFELYCTKMRGEYKFPKGYQNPKVGRFFDIS